MTESSSDFSMEDSDDIMKPAMKASLESKPPVVIPATRPTGDKPIVIPQAMPKAMPQDKPQAIPQVIPATRPQVIPQDKPQAIPQDKPQDMPQTDIEDRPTELPTGYRKAIRMEILNQDPRKRSMPNMPSFSTLLSHLSRLPDEPRFKNRRHHFYIKHAADRRVLEEMLQGTYGERLRVRIDDPLGEPTSNYEKNDIHLTLDQKPAGEIQFLLCNYPDIGHTSQYYIHVYFQKFMDDALFEHVQSAMIQFFQSLNKRTHSIRHSRHTRKHRRMSFRTRSIRKQKKFDTRRRRHHRVR